MRVEPSGGAEMDLSQALDVAIGIFLMYLLLSLFVTAVNELISSICDLRAKHLAEGLERLLTCSDPSAGKENWFDEFSNTNTYKIIQGLCNSGKRPPYIDAGQFFDIIREVMSAKSNNQQLTDGGITAQLNALPAGPMRDKLLSIAADAGQSIDSFKTSVGKWYDDSMQRLSGAYSKQMQSYSFVIGLLTALFVQADTIQVAEYLWRDDKARAEMVKLAIEKTSAPSLVAAPSSNGANLDGLDKVSARIEKVDQTYTELNRMPLGWHKKVEDWYAMTGEGLDKCLKRAVLVLQGLIGIMITAFAISLGAPFWFDILKKVVNIRAIGLNPAEQKSEEKKSGTG